MTESRKRRRAADNSCEYRPLVDAGLLLNGVDCATSAAACSILREGREFISVYTGQALHSDGHGSPQCSVQGSGWWLRRRLRRTEGREDSSRPQCRGKEEAERHKQVDRH